MTMHGDRRIRCQSMGLDCDACEALIEHPAPLASVVSSRLGHDAARHRNMARHLAESMRAFRENGSTVLIAKGTAIEPWAAHAADVFHVPTMVIKKMHDRDRWLTAIPDRVDAVYLRTRGKIADLLQERLASRSGTTRVAVDGKASQALLQNGAVGSYLPKESPTTMPDCTSTPAAIDTIPWKDYLVHCTRSAESRWPGQTIQQYRNDMLLGDFEIASRSVGASLRRIVQQRRLTAGATTSNHEHRVVCFSELPLPELLRRRTYRSHLHRWDYEPFGIAITKSAASRIGIQPVIYGNSQIQSTLRPEDRFRFQAQGERNDWRKEQEWRADGDVDLDALDPKDVLIFMNRNPMEWSIHSVNQNRWAIVNAD